MVITITTYGTSLRKNNECIEITEPNGKVHTFPPHEVSALVLSVPCKFTSEIVSLCMEHNIYITMTDRRGTPLWHIEPFEGGSVPLLRRKQLLLSERREGVQLTQALLQRKLGNRVSFLNKLAVNRRDERGELLNQHGKEITDLAEKIAAVQGVTIADCRQTLLGYEGSAGRVYFSALAILLPPEAEFKGRARGAGSGTFNQMLNYGYGVLYREILGLCAKARLDPYIGVMHVDNYNRPTLVYDLVEPFRVDVEQAVFFLFSRRRVRSEEHFEASGKELALSKEGKYILMKALYRVWKEPQGLGMGQLVSGLAKGLDKWSIEKRET